MSQKNNQNNKQDVQQTLTDQQSAESQNPDVNDQNGQDPAAGQDVQQVNADLVKMFRDEAPFTADVHQDEVENFIKGGWRIKE